MTTQELSDMLLSVSREMKKHTQELCRLDSYIGDGDHGFTIERGFDGVEKLLLSGSYDTPAQLLKAVGDTMMSTTGGAIGPILGSFFRGGCKKLADAQEMGVNEFEIMLEMGLRQIRLIGEAEEGDRTLVDALAPAVAAYKSTGAQGKDLGECMDSAASAAEKGAENTKNMVAKKGRAKFLGEKSLGYVDAGATSMSLILRAMSDFING